MAIPSSQIIASWVKEELASSEWVSLSELCLTVVQKYWKGVSEGEAYELVEKNLEYVAEHLRDEAGEWHIDGKLPIFEIDNEPSPYIRVVGSRSKDILLKLRKIDPFKFEDVCTNILIKLGADAHTTQPTNDGGVDFIGKNLKIVPSALGLPSACKAVVIGQAKRYKDGNLIKESLLREFVGASTLKRHQLEHGGNLGPLAPKLYAFWTTSDFDPNAKAFAREMGLWYMDGRTLADYIESLNLREYVMALPDV